MPVITIRGPFGSEAPEIGELIARKLGIDYVDRKIIADVAQQLRTSSQAIAEKEMPPSTLLGRIAEAIRSNYAFDSGYLDMYMPLVDIPLDDKNYLAGLQHVIKEMAKCQAIVIRGRGSQFILKDFPGVFHVLIAAPLDHRVNRVMEEMKTDEKKAREEIKQFDNSIHEFTKRYFRAEIDDPVHYDLVINTGHFSVEAAAALTIQALSMKQEVPVADPGGM
jgi:cytidylate kinase